MAGPLGEIFDHGMTELISKKMNVEFDYGFKKVVML